MNILVIDARWQDAVADALVDSATACLQKRGARFDRVSVPGVLEIPGAIAIAARSPQPFHGYVALGCVTGPAHAAEPYYTHAMQGLTMLSTTGLAIGNGIVLASDEGAARDLAMTHDIGGDAARACLSLVLFAQRQGLLP